MHFLEMLQFDGREANFGDVDEDRRDHVAFLLQEWGLVDIIDEDITRPENPPKISIIKKDTFQKEEWKTIKKYTIGKV
jgi:hypothetical protein